MDGDPVHLVDAVHLVDTVHPPEETAEWSYVLWRDRPVVMSSLPSTTASQRAANERSTGLPSQQANKITRPGGSTVQRYGPRYRPQLHRALQPTVVVVVDVDVFSDFAAEKLTALTNVLHSRSSRPGILHLPCRKSRRRILMTC